MSPNTPSAAKKVTNSAFQPSTDLAEPVGPGALHVYMWTSQPLGRAGVNPGPNQTNEIDLGTYYMYPSDFIMKGSQLDVGYQYYWYPDNGGTAGNLERNQEFHIGIQMDSTALIGTNLNPEVYYYYDFILDQSTFFAQIQYNYDMGDMTGLKGLTFVPTASIGWLGANRTFGDQLVAGTQSWRNSYIFYFLSAELDYKFNSWVTAFAGVRYTGNNDGTSNGLGGADPQGVGSANSIWGGFGLKFGM